MQNYYQMFQLSPNTPTEEIRYWIHHQVRYWSNRINAPTKERRQQAEWMLRILREMEETLLDSVKRAEYDLSIELFESGSKTPSRSISRFEDELKTQIDTGWTLLNEGNTEDVLLLAGEVTANYPSKPEGWMLLGQAHIKRGELESALTPFQTACDLCPENSEYLFKLGNLLVALKNYEQAEDILTRAIALDSKFEYRHALGTLYVKQGKMTKGIALFWKIVLRRNRSKVAK